VRYFSEIPDMIRLLRTEKRELEDKYNTLNGSVGDGTPGSGEPGKPVERAVERLEAAGTWERLQEIEKKLKILERDEADVRRCLDDISGRYKFVLKERYLRGRSWASIATRAETPDSTVRYWHDKALERLGEALETLPQARELLGRASRARS
jgi:DNA-directed RNA polymerase specialized sigma24 family protein